MPYARGFVPCGCELHHHASHTHTPTATPRSERHPVHILSDVNSLPRVSLRGGVAAGGARAPCVAFGSEGHKAAEGGRPRERAREAA